MLIEIIMKHRNKVHSNYVCHMHINNPAINAAVYICGMFAWHTAAEMRISILWKSLQIKASTLRIYSQCIANTWFRWFWPHVSFHMKSKKETQISIYDADAFCAHRETHTKDKIYWLLIRWYWHELCACACVCVACIASTFYFKYWPELEYASI